MIIDKLYNSDRYTAMHPKFKLVFDTLKTLDPKDGAPEFVVEENNVIVHGSVVEATPEGPRQFEAHKEYIDVHYILQGEETYVYANLDELTPATEYDEADDYFMLEGKGSTVTLKAGDICIVYPEDAHIPTLTKVSDEAVIRSVVKVKL